AVGSLAPYTVLKLLWLSGSNVGMIPGSEPSQMQNVRMEVGNIITVGLALVGVIIVLALSQRWGERLPAWIVVLPGAGATGALAPIALGLPVGMVIQVIAVGTVSSGGEGTLTGQVFAVVYGGFAVFGVALAILFADYCQRRWPVLLAASPQRPQNRWTRVAS